MRRIKGETLVKYLDNIIYEDVQVKEEEIHLTVKSIYKYKDRGELDFGGSEYSDANIIELPTKKRRTSDDYGWWFLDSGEYYLEYNEEITGKPGGKSLFIVEPLKRLTRNGASHPIFTVNEKGELFTVLKVGENGINIKENSRISKLLVISD